MIEETIKQLGGIDIVIANAVYMPFFALLYHPKCCYGESKGFCVLMKHRAGLNSQLLVIWMLWMNLNGTR